MILRNSAFAKYSGVEGQFWKTEGETYRVQIDKKNNTLKGFKEYDIPELNDKVYIDISVNEIESAYYVYTFCKFRGGVYHFENIWNNTAILIPDSDTKKQLGLHVYDDRRVEINLQEFINEVEKIWENYLPYSDFPFPIELEKDVELDKNKFLI